MFPSFWGILDVGDSCRELPCQVLGVSHRFEVETKPIFYVGAWPLPAEVTHVKLHDLSFGEKGASISVALLPLLIFLFTPVKTLSSGQAKPIFAAYPCDT